MTLIIHLLNKTWAQNPWALMLLKKLWILNFLRHWESNIDVFMFTKKIDHRFVIGSLTLPVPCIFKRKALKTFVKLFEAPKRSVKIKIYLNFFSLSGIGTERVNTPLRHNLHGDHLFGTYTKLSEKVLFLTPWYKYVRMRIRR